MKALVIGGGIFGICAAIELSKAGVDVELFEQDSELMQGATSVNQNRFHLGYHYPRSIPTATQCQEGASGFKEYFGSSLINIKENYYAIGKNGSRVSFEQYLNFCKSNNLPYTKKYPKALLLKRSRVSGCILVDEQIIDLLKFKRLAHDLLKKKKVKVYLKRMFKKGEGSGYDVVVNATYSNFNYINKMLGLPLRKFRYDICNVPIIETPRELAGVGITIMDGNFYSILPYGRTPYHLFWSVQGSTIRSEGIYPSQKKSHKIANYRDDTYIPLLKYAKLIDVLRTIKILAYDVEYSDERITDLINYGDGKYAILSAKINTCVSTAQKLASIVNRQK